jgi:ribosome-binding factor A
MKQRTERLGLEIQSIVAELLARGEVKDPRVRNAGLVTITRVQVTGDLRDARVAFTVYGAAGPELERVRAGLDAASGHLRRALGRRLRVRATPSLTFEIDHALDHAFHVDALLKEIGATPGTAADEVDPGDGGDGDGDGGDGGSGGDDGDGGGGPNTEPGRQA